MLVGRNKEIEIMDAAVCDDRSHFIAVYGRRRVGKTHLIREVNLWRIHRTGWL